ncbi:uncharacterized protein SPPG_00204 [Spizellomyces punctatus DAOM BR117]|uniref:NodB homology domain-containing protein n=1 Tax=Spizellomyces punctatus (strain DAOM BR117) TaxID=645134 RepID=A0A0L0HTQ5_SPIPD|nr:uncharacterized protein SPPG_00204 [Spizellomyces punctatus DAOM BR117]KND04477.1 hypothetical protein SPPG_00204 [Spizellomyces punctatus DAOM BR117]|eukprot:XP_016612516.1 hypothetical protein SPPG_00204 [Spizellomyces punctatus DAOM BR117]
MLARILSTAFVLLPLVTAQTPINIPAPVEGDPATQPANDPTYACPATCVPPACVCASTKIPGGLSVEQTPMFVTLTADDAIQDPTYEPFSQVLNSTVNPNGCNLPFTYFVSTAWTNFWLITRAYNLGHEIGAHTINHPDLTTVSATVRDQEIQGSAQAVMTYGGIPKSDLAGFRHPFLAFNKDSFDSVAKAGFKYDSSVTLDPLTQPYWPHTLDYGFAYYPQPCIKCPSGPSMQYKGMWEIPMYNLLTNDSKLWSSMDPIINPQLNDYDVALSNIKATFQVHYKTKLPFGLYQHLAQLVAWGPEVEVKKVQLLKDFVAWTQKEFKDVWYVTNQQLISWIQKPVPADQMRTFLPCRPPAVDKANKEICDGIDNDGDGIIDNGVVETCQVTEEVSFQSCYGCPTLVPNITQPVPPQKGNATRKPAPDAACPNAGTWDPIAGACITLTRPQVKIPDSNASGSKPSGTNGDQSKGSGTVAGAKVAKTSVFGATLLLVAVLSA